MNDLTLEQAAEIHDAIQDTCAACPFGGCCP